MAVNFDTASSTSEVGMDGVINHNHTCLGSQRALVVGAGSRGSAQASTSTTYNANSMTEKWDFASVSSSVQNSLYVRAVDADGAGSLPIVNTLAGSPGVHGLIAASFTGVHQTTPTGATPTNVNSTGTTATVDVSSVDTIGANDMLVDLVVIVADETKTVGAAQTEQGRVDLQNVTHMIMSTQPGSSGGVMTWTIGGSGGDGHGLNAIALKPAPTGTQNALAWIRA